MSLYSLDAIIGFLQCSCGHGRGHTNTQFTEVWSQLKIASLILRVMYFRVHGHDSHTPPPFPQATATRPLRMALRPLLVVKQDSKDYYRQSTGSREGATGVAG